MKQFLTVLRFELNTYFKNKSFLITTFILMIVIVGSVVIPTFFINQKNDEAIVDVSNDTLDATTLGIVLSEDITKNKDSFLQMTPVHWKQYPSKDALSNAVKNEDVVAGFVLHNLKEYSYIVNNRSLSDDWSLMFENSLKKWNKKMYLMEQGLNEQQIMQLDQVNIKHDEIVLGKDSVQSFGYTYVLIFAIYFLILFYGQMIAVSITNEKSNRAIEILVTSVHPNSLIFGKVLAGAIAGLIQMTLILGSGFIAYAFVENKWNGQLDFLFNIPGNVWITYSAFGLFSYLLYSFIFGALGALVSKTEDISKSSMPVMLIYIVSFFIGIYGLQNSDNMLMKIASFIPFTSGNAMFIRVSMGNVALWEILISFGLLVVTCIFIGILAAKLFRFGTLNYGNPIRIRSAIKNIKNQ